MASLRSIREVQQDFATTLGYRRETIWDLLSYDQSNILKEKIQQWMPDPNCSSALEKIITNIQLESEAENHILRNQINALMPDENMIDNAINDLESINLSFDQKFIFKQKINRLIRGGDTIENTIKELHSIPNPQSTFSPSQKLTITSLVKRFCLNDAQLEEKIKDLISVLELTGEKRQKLVKDINALIRDWRKSKKSMAEMRDTLFQSIWAQRKYTNSNSMTAVIFVCVTTAETNALNTRKYSCHLVFRCRKCVDENDDTSGCCMAFVDENGRVYGNWEAYLNNNVLPSGTMVAPRNGIYTFNNTDQVELEVHPTPASSPTQKLLKAGDTTAAIAGFGALLVPLAALATAPISAPILAGAAAVGMATAGYSAVRSGHNLIDRSQHEQSIDISNRQARNSWFSVVGGAVGVGAAGATRMMTTVAAAGREVSVATELFVNSMNIMTIIITGTATATGVFDMILRYNDDEEIEVFDVLQLAASLTMFTHSVYNFRFASTVVNEARNSTIKGYRESLSNRQRRAFDKISKETIRIRGETKGKMDIIRNVNDIPSKQYLNDIYKINKNLNKENVRPAFRPAGSSEAGIVLNNEMHVDTQILRGNIDMLNQVSQPIPTTYTDMNGGSGGGGSAGASLIFSKNTQLSAQSANSSKKQNNLSDQVQAIGNAVVLVYDGIKFVLKDMCSNLVNHIGSVQSFEDIVTTIGNRYGGECLKFLLRLANTFVNMELKNIETLLKTFISSESILYRMLMHCFQHYANVSLVFLEEKTFEILEAVKTYFLSVNPNCPANLRKKCDKCPGSYQYR